ncbi:MAG TPA: DotU family type IV/VI secretion system protein [Paraburkholderia sp.]|nr:DotU family type IV/VI secretion system protein [Paraburkholderia sp.]
MKSFIDDQPASHRAAGTGIRDLLRDTALLVTMLVQGGNSESVETLRPRCRQLMNAFSTAMDQRGIAADVRDDALYAQCGLLDETVLRYLPADDKHIWDAQPLQVEHFGKHDAGEHVFERLALRMREEPPNADLLEAYAAILGLGFLGRYARDGEARRVAVMAALAIKLEKLRPAVQRPFVSDHTEPRVGDWFRRLSPWAIAGFCCAAAALVYLVWGHALDVQVAHQIAAPPTSSP